MRGPARRLDERGSSGPKGSPNLEIACTDVDFLPINGSNPRIRRYPHSCRARRAKMTKMITCLWFDRGKAREAAEFYASVFPNSHVGKAHASAVDIPSAKVGEDLTVEFTVLVGQAYVGLNGGPNFKPNEAVSF